MFVGQTLFREQGKIAALSKANFKIRSAMQVLIVGGGGREHALAWKVAQSQRVVRVYVAPGNAGTAREPKIANVAISAEDIGGLVEFATDQKVDLAIIGPEAPLVAGVVDAFRAQGLACFGPVQRAAQLEGSKSFTKDFLSRYHIPTAESETFVDLEAATDYIESRGAPIVVKADGLAAGKGVTVAHTVEEAVAAAAGCLSENKHGDAGSKIVVEECLTGEEASFICIVDGENVLPLASSQDHKARDNGDTGPNTGGMGAYSPAPVVTDEMHQRIMHDIIRPTVRGLVEDGAPYTGFLYAGLMIGTDGVPRVLEYNCRFGDPETQPILMRLQSDLVALCEAALQGRLDDVQAQWDSRAAVGVVMAAGGYPESYRKGDVIAGLDDVDSDTVKVFHAGSRDDQGQVVTNGGRVLCVTALGATVYEAQEQAYQAVGHIRWDGVYYRTDIGYRAVIRERNG